jgi:UDP:flavonoid glycosyltransferase YjiC (YdhE family)
MTTCLPDLQPRHHLYDDRFFKFIGSTINEEVNSRNYSLNKDEKLEELLNNFEIKESKMNILEEPTDKLIYVSLGTIFNSDLRVYKIILKAFKTIDLEPFETRSNIKLKNLKIIISTGSIVYNKFQELLGDNEYKLPENMILVKSAPQTEILKRASLFVTHCGMNSTSESVHYGGYYKI